MDPRHRLALDALEFTAETLCAAPDLRALVTGCRAVVTAGASDAVWVVALARAEASRSSRAESDPERMLVQALRAVASGAPEEAVRVARSCSEQAIPQYVYEVQGWREASDASGYVQRWWDERLAQGDKAR